MLLASQPRSQPASFPNLTPTKRIGAARPSCFSDNPGKPETTLERAFGPLGWEGWERGWEDILSAFFVTSLRVTTSFRTQKSTFEAPSRTPTCASV